MKTKISVRENWILYLKCLETTLNNVMGHPNNVMGHPNLLLKSLIHQAKQNISFTFQEHGRAIHFPFVAGCKIHPNPHQVINRGIFSIQYSIPLEEFSFSKFLPYSLSLYYYNS